MGIAHAERLIDPEALRAQRARHEPGCRGDRYHEDEQIRPTRKAAQPGEA
jgi:hypothetical protein